MQRIPTNRLWCSNMLIDFRLLSQQAKRGGLFEGGSIPNWPRKAAQLSTIRSDVDNLTKFVLDSMNGVIYEDDRQITSIHATKILDNEDLCTGSIEVFVRSIDVDDVESILASSIAIADPDVQ